MCRPIDAIMLYRELYGVFYAGSEAKPYIALACGWKLGAHQHLPPFIHLRTQESGVSSLHFAFS